MLMNRISFNRNPAELIKRNHRVRNYVIRVPLAVMPFEVDLSSLYVRAPNNIQKIEDFFFS